MANEVKVEADIPQTVNYQTCTVQAGTTTTLASNQNATVTNSGTQYNAIFNFGIPSGKSAYEQAVAGGYTGTEAEFNAALASDITTVATNISDINTVGADIANVNTVAGNTTNIDTVAGISSDVTTVAGISSDVTNVSGISAAIVAVDNNESAIQNVSDNLANVNSVASNMNSVLATAADITNIDTVANNTTNIDTVAGISTNVTTVAGIASDVTAVKNNAADISTVATNITDVGTVATNATAVNAVAADLTNIDAVNANKTNIDAVAGNNTNITAVAGNATNINAVNANKSNIDAVAGNSSNINSVASNATNINTVATNISDIGTVARISTDVSAVAGVAADVSAVAADLENIDEVATKVAEWQKPADWVDIRSGAIHNSIYALVGHTANYSSYNNFGFEVTLSNNTHSFEVYIDNVLQGTYTSGSTVGWNWSDLALTTGGTTTTPVPLVTHTLRITPVNSEDTLKIFRVARNGSTGTRYRQGWIWVHFAISYAMERVSFSVYNRVIPWLLTAVTALGDNLYLTGSDQSGFLGGIWDLWVDKSSYLAYLPTIEVNSITNGSGMLNFEGPLKRAKLVVNGVFGNDTNYSSFSAFCSGGLNELEINKPIILSSRTSDVTRVFISSKLKRLPAIDVSRATSSLNMFLTEDTNLEPTELDFRPAKSARKVGCYGTSANKMLGLKGLLVSNEAPFDDTGSPQINVSYTGMDRNALVNLFKSMPYNVGYTVVGSPTITSGVASGFSSSNHLELTDTFDPKKPYKIQVKFKLNSNFSGNPNTLFGIPTGGFFNIRINQSGKINLLVGNGESDFNVASIAGTTTLSANTDYWAQFEFTGTKYIIRLSTDGTTWTEENSLDSTTVPNPGNPFTLQIGDGHSTHWYFRGAIDLNDTYIKVNGVPWFTGKAAMTKTCSVVGCTGAADLTAEDKAIATDKGWSLTLS